MSIRAHCVTYTVQGATLLREVSVTCMPGAFTAIVGANGAGKSTLLGLICGDLAPSSGDVTFDSARLQSYSPRDLALRRAVVPQFGMPAFGLPVYAYVALARAPYGEALPARVRAVAHALEAVSAMSLSHRDVLTLSGGERQRVTLARALAQIGTADDASHSRFLLLDEPTAALDLKQSQGAYKVMRDAARAGAGVIAVLHDLAAARRHADHVIMLQNGRVLAEGGAAAVLTADNVATAFDVDLMTAEAALGLSAACNRPLAAE